MVDEIVALTPRNGHRAQANSRANWARRRQMNGGEQDKPETRR